MRIESVRAYAFGPFKDPPPLSLAPGMTVLFGLNESGKSSWHAALYAGLCGMRRSRGQPRVEDRDFTRRFHPWDHEEWEVGAIVVLDDSRRIELRHDLAGMVDCRATDLNLGRDVSDEIVFDGSPDGSTWLGLDRRSFLATACVRQAQLLSVLSEPALLQEHMQRAAATAGTDETAAAALVRLANFRSEYVGLDRANSRKPLRRARNRLQEATEALELAQREHREYLELAGRAQGLAEEADELADKRHVLEAALASHRAEELRDRLARATELAARFPNGEPASSALDEGLAERVARALQAWETRPEPVTLDGPSLSELSAEIATLPEPPVGDLEPDPAIVRAVEAVNRTQLQVETHAAQKPEDLTVSQVAVPEQELVDFARDLETEIPPIDEPLKAELTERQRALDALGGRGGKPKTWLVGGGLVAALGVGLIAAGLVVPGIVAAIAGAGLSAWALASRGDRRRVDAMESLRDLELRIGEGRLAHDSATRRVQNARERVSELGLEPDPAALRNLAEGVRLAQDRARALSAWVNTHEALERVSDDALASLGELLRTGGIGAENPMSAAHAYISACRERARVAPLASKRAEMTRGLDLRKQAEQQAEAAERQRQAAGEQVRAAAAECDVAGPNEEAIAYSLREWQGQRAKGLERHDQARKDWADLQALLGWGTLADLSSEAEDAMVAATRLSDGLTDEELAEVAAQGDLETSLSAARGEANRAAQLVAQHAGQVQEREGRLRNVAEAEEEVRSAQTELRRVKRLERTLDVTREFLEEAQERVHRDIAPVLRGTLVEWLPRITAGRYVDALVDPHTLEIKVKGASGRPRDASLLSHGTAEQIYLLLRMAMAERLVTTGESCPLILDDVTVQCDTERTQHLLDLLHELSKDRQIVVFSQENDVLDWAKEHLQEPHDRWAVLDPSAIPA
jgi:exonuclease SbcC